MWSVIEQLMVTMAITILKSTVKNPTAVKEEGAVIAAVAQAATQADTAVNGTVWTSTAAAAPAA